MHNQTVVCPTRRFRTAGLILGWIGVALLPLASTGCKGKAGATTSSENEPKVVEVITTKPEPKQLTRNIEQPGYLRPYDQTDIFTKIAGYAKDWKVDKGSWVKKGDLLLELYLPEDFQELKVRAAQVTVATANLKQSKEAANAANAAVEAAKADIDAKYASIQSELAAVERWAAEEVRGRRLLFEKVFNQQELDEIIHERKVSEAKREEATAKWSSAKAFYQQASAYYLKTKADVEVADALLLKAKADYAKWEDWLKYSRITAPYDGLVTDRFVSPDDFLQPTTSGTTSKSAKPIFTMMDLHVLRCDVDVPELDAPLVQVGDTAIVRLQAKPGKEFEGKVTLKRDALDTKSRTLSVEVFLDNSKFLENHKKELMPGMYANVTIKSKTEKMMSLPENAILSDILADGDKYYCYVVEGNKVQKTFLDLGAHCEDGVQVLRKQMEDGKWQPLTGNEIVVIEPKKKSESKDGKEAEDSRVVGPKALRDGQAVTVVKDSSDK